MGRRSSIEQLPQELFDAINKALNEGQTIEQVVAYMEGMGAKLSPSAVGRHKKKIAEVGERIRKSRMIAEAVGREIGDKPDDKMAAINIELLHDQIMRLVSAGEDGDGDDATMSPKELREISDALFRLASARKLDTDRVLKIQQEAAKKAVKSASEVVKTELKKLPGIGKEAIAAIEHQVLGVVR